ncbi:MAG: nucleoside triphosphate pyrophosphohydrolase [bacterium]|jgi:tetrapyrrole methylase family protein/MazG family protein
MEKEQYSLAPLMEILEQLLGENGCPWDKQQTHSSLRPYLLEESYEVVEAIEENDMHKLCEELGDLLLQIAFHAQLAQQRGDFTLNDVINTVTEKIIRRHPHVFGNIKVKDSEEVLVNWQQIKEREKESNGQDSILAGIPRQLPALMGAVKLQGRAARVGFDWDSITGAWEKVEEEMGEVWQAIAKDCPAAVEAEIGDLLFAVVNVARFLQVDPETALLRTNNKFKQRFYHIEREARERGKKLEEMTLQEMDKIWEKAKTNGKVCENNQE